VETKIRGIMLRGVPPEFTLGRLCGAIRLVRLVQALAMEITLPVDAAEQLARFGLVHRSRQKIHSPLAVDAPLPRFKPHRGAVG